MRGGWKVLSGMIAVTAVVGLVAAVHAEGTASSGGMTEKEKAQKEPYPNDLGPATIDVSGYPAAIQKKYEDFKQCGQCHSIARPINSQYFSEDQWRRYVKRMMSKPGCELKKGTPKLIFEFLVYDSKQRKIAHKAEWKKHREDLLTEFKAKYPDRYKLLFEDRSPAAEAAKELPGW